MSGTESTFKEFIPTFRSTITVLFCIKESLMIVLLFKENGSKSEEALKGGLANVGQGKSFRVLDQMHWLLMIEICNHSLI